MTNFGFTEILKTSKHTIARIWVMVELFGKVSWRIKWFGNFLKIGYGQTATILVYF